MAAPRHPVLVRPTTESDLDFVLATERDPDNAPFILEWSREEHAAALGRPDMVHWIMEALPDRRRVGYIILAGIGGRHRSIEFRRVAVAEKGHGFGRAALRLVK